MLAIDNRRPRLLSLKDAISCYIEHRREVVIRRTKYLLKQAEIDAEKLEALLLALSRLDEFIQMIRTASSRDEAEARIKAYTFTLEAAQSLGILIRSQPSVRSGRYVFTDLQVKHILDLRLYQLTALERTKLEADYNSLLSTIQDLMDILAKESRVLTLIKDELIALKDKHGTERLTKIEAAEGEINIEDLIANQANIVTITHRGFIKRTLSTEYRTQARGGKGLKGMETREASGEDDAADFVEHLFAASAHDYLMFFTNTGRVYVERVYQIPEMARTGKGRSIKNLLNLRAEEKIAAVLRLVAGGDHAEGVWRSDRFVLFATKDGTVKKTELADFKNIRKDGIIAIKIDEGNDLIQVILTDGTSQISLVTSEGMCVRCEETDIRAMGRAAAGVMGIRPSATDYVVSLTAVDHTAQLLVVSENGLGKRTPFEEYRKTNRGAKGVTTMNITEKTGNVVAAMAVHEDDELMLMTSTGQSVRIRVADIRQTGRNAQGVKLMNLGEGETVQDVAKVIPDEDDKVVADAIAEVVAADGASALETAESVAPEAGEPGAAAEGDPDAADTDEAEDS
jgi:DNA gyrase subunit A